MIRNKIKSNTSVCVHCVCLFVFGFRLGKNVSHAGMEEEVECYESFPFEGEKETIYCMNI